MSMYKAYVYTMYPHKQTKKELKRLLIWNKYVEYLYAWLVKLLTLSRILFETYMN